MSQCSQRQSPLSVLTRPSAEFTSSLVHTIIKPNGDDFRRSFPGWIPSGCVNPETTNEKERKSNRAQCNSSRSDVSPSIPRENANTEAVQRTTWGTVMNPTGHYAHMFEERWEKEIYPNNNRDPYKEEIKIVSPHPRKRKNIKFFFPTRRIHNFPKITNMTVKNETDIIQVYLLEIIFK